MLPVAVALTGSQRWLRTPFLQRRPRRPQRAAAAGGVSPPGGAVARGEAAGAGAGGARARRDPHPAERPPAPGTAGTGEWGWGPRVHGCFSSMVTIYLKVRGGTGSACFCSGHYDASLLLSWTGDQPSSPAPFFRQKAQHILGCCPIAGTTVILP